MKNCLRNYYQPCKSLLIHLLQQSPSNWLSRKQTVKQGSSQKKAIAISDVSTENNCLKKKKSFRGESWHHLSKWPCFSMGVKMEDSNTGSPRNLTLLQELQVFTFLLRRMWQSLRISDYQVLPILTFLNAFLNCSYPALTPPLYSGFVCGDGVFAEKTWLMCLLVNRLSKRRSHGRLNKASCHLKILDFETAALKEEMNMFYGWENTNMNYLCGQGKRPLSGLVGQDL